MHRHPGDCNGAGCRLCWLAANDQRYQRLWGVLPKLTWCRHLGDVTGDLAECDSCEGRVRIKLLLCSIHGDCTTHKQVDGHQCCRGCNDYEPAV